MRFTAMITTATLTMMMALAAAPAAAQAPPSEAHPYGLDPYKPSDLYWLRNYGATLVAQTPLAELLKLDPYKPSDAALLRQLGGAIPLWALSWYPPPPVPAPLTPFPAAVATPESHPAGTTVVIVVPPSDHRFPRRLLPDDSGQHAPDPRHRGPGREASVQVSTPASRAGVEPDYRLLAATATSPLEEELRAATASGYELVGMVTGETQFGSHQPMVVVRRPTAP